MNRVWIELERPMHGAHAEEIVAKANRMLKRLAGDGALGGTFGWDNEARTFTFGSPMGYEQLIDRGQWFNLDYLGRE
jgi:hypothetical protein